MPHPYFFSIFCCFVCVGFFFSCILEFPGKRINLLFPLFFLYCSQWTVLNCFWHFWIWIPCLLQSGTGCFMSLCLLYCKKVKHKIIKVSDHFTVIHKVAMLLCIIVLPTDSWTQDSQTFLTENKMRTESALLVSKDNLTQGQGMRLVPLFLSSVLLQGCGEWYRVNYITTTWETWKSHWLFSRIKGMKSQFCVDAI